MHFQILLYYYKLTRQLFLALCNCDETLALFAPFRVTILLYVYVNDGMHRSARKENKMMFKLQEQYDNLN